LNKGFPAHGTFKISAETKTPNGIALTTTATRSVDEKGEKISATLEPKYEWKQQNIEFTGKLAAEGLYEAGLSVKDLGTAGTKVTITGIESDKDGIAAKLGLAYKSENLGVKAGVKYPFHVNSFANLNAEAVFRYPENVFWGVDIRYDVPVRDPDTKSELKKTTHFWNAKASYVAELFQATVHLENVSNRGKTADDHPTLSLLHLSLLQHVNLSTKFAAGLSVEQKNLQGAGIALATEHKVDKDTVLKGKLAVTWADAPNDREFRVALGAKQQVSEHAAITLGADINTRAILGSATGSTKPHSFGFEIKWT